MAVSRRRLLALGGLLAARPEFAWPQSERRIRRIGYHSGASSQSNAGWLDAFREGMAQIGWLDGRDSYRARWCCAADRVIQ